jgi:hypothetical protein
MLHRSAFALGLLTLACGDPATPDAGVDAGSDAGRDVGVDGGSDAGPLPSCGAATPLELTQCVESARYQTDLEAIAMPREPASAHWQVVQDLVADRLEGYGFTVERHTYATGVNVVGVLSGTSDPTHRVILGAHYDHIPGCAGADDNASGTAGALEAARVLSMASYPRTLVVVFWDEEERGLIGSEAHAARATATGETIDAVFDFEMIGYTSDEPGSQTIPTGFDVLFRDSAREVEANEYRGDFIAAVSDMASEPAVATLERYADRIGLPFVPLVVPDSLISSPLLGDLRRSDHAAYWDEGFPAIMLTDTSNFRYASYHCIDGEDVTANLDQAFSGLVIAATVGAVAETLGLAP